MKHILKKMMKPGDWLVIGLVSILFIWSLIHYSRRKNGDTVIVYRFNKNIYELSLQKDQILNFQGLTGDMQLSIKNNQAWISESSCPNKICIHMGKIKTSGQTIICLPNRILITIKSRNALLYDGITQ